MTTPAQLRKAALALPRTEERSRTFAVDGAAFADLGRDGLVRLRLPAEEADRLAGELDAVRVEQDGRAAVALSAIGGQALNHWVRRAWRYCAPPDLVAADEAAARAQAGQVGDLPKAIGSPATRALAAAGITTLAQAASYSEDELLALHGVGPKAVRLLRQARS